jgi:hypothetical protein
MYELFHSIYAGASHPTLENFVDLIAKIQGLNSQDRSARAMILDSFKEYADQEVRTFAAKHGDKLLTHWMMLKKSQFNQGLWQKFQDVSKFCEGIVNGYIADELSSLMKVK